MVLTSINCHCKEYRNINNAWVLYSESDAKTDSVVIGNMLSASQYFVLSGGKHEVRYKNTCGLGLQVVKITCISSCSRVKKVYNFSYKNARHIP